MPSSSPPRDPGAVVLLEFLLPDPASVAWVYSFEQKGGSADAKVYDGICREEEHGGISVEGPDGRHRWWCCGR
mgnify:CR=1 FL=1